MKIEVLGPGCTRCNNLADNTKLAAEELNLDFDLTKVTDLKQIASYGVMMTPALVLDGKVVLSGKVPNTAELKDLLAAAR